MRIVVTGARGMLGAATVTYLSQLGINVLAVDAIPTTTYEPGVEYLRADGTIGYDPVRVVDFYVLENNEWLVVNQLTVSEGGHNRRPDVVVFLNGLPIAVIELKNAASESATIWSAFQQLQTYKQELPSLFVFNELLVISDGLEARIGTLSSNKERFLPWRTIERVASVLCR